MIAGREKGAGVQRADAICDECGKSDTFTCDYERQPDGTWRPLERQVVRKAQGVGWAYIKNKLYCPKCKAARKKEPPMSKPSENANEPTRAQKREIMDLLEECYDTKAIRQIVAIRRRDANDVAEEQAVLDIYKGALGMSL